jgi:hypothetical protein
MPDEIQQGQDIEVKEQTQVEMPATEVKPAEELPVDASEHAKQQFEKLKEHNKKLAEKLARYEQEEANSVLDSLTRSSQQVIADSNLPQDKVENIVQNLTDENGYIDEALLKKTLQESTQTANNAVQAARLAQESARKAEERISKYEQNETIKKAYAEFPQSDPDNDNFDPKFIELVKNEMIGQAMNRVQPNFYEACRKWSSFTQPVQPKVEQIVAKEQVNAGGTNTKPNVSHENLVDGTRKGDHNSIAARLAASGL